jgi:MOSC domain-containing protein
MNLGASMPHVVALYRYPVKGFTPEECDTLAVLDQGKIAGDRVLGVRFADTQAADDTWSRKSGMVALINTPGLARLHVSFDEKALRLRINLGPSLLADEPLNPEGRRRIGAALADYVLKLDENPLTDHPERLPLRVIGDGRSPRYHDEEAGRVTLHGRGSLQALEAAIGNEVSELRFRSNIAVDGLPAWEEQSWVGRKVRIGNVTFDVVKPKTRCLATHANPITGERDLPILTTLTQKMGQENPTFAVAMLPTGAGGQIRVGDPVTLVDQNRSEKPDALFRRSEL